MSTKLETAPPRTTAPTTQLPPREPKLPVDGPERPDRWWLWLLAVPAILAAVVISIMLAPVDTVDPGETYMPDRMLTEDGWLRPAHVPAATTAEIPLRQGLTPGLVDGWYDPLQDLGTADTPLRQGYTPGLADGWFDPAAAAAEAIEDVVAPSYPAIRVR